MLQRREPRRPLRSAKSLAIQACRSCWAAGCPALVGSRPRAAKCPPSDLFRSETGPRYGAPNSRQGYRWLTASLSLRQCCVPCKQSVACVNSKVLLAWPDMSTDLDQEVFDLLNGRKGDWQAVAAASNVSYSWLSKFANGHIPNPGFSTLKRLHAALTGGRNSEGAPTPKESADA